MPTSAAGDAFVEDATAALAASGIPPFDIFSEVFSSNAEVPGGLAPRTVKLSKSEREFVWSPEQGTLLDAADAAGLTLPSGLPGRAMRELQREVDLGRRRTLGFL